MDKRPTKDEYWLTILDGIKQRASCPRRQGGAVIVDEDNILLASGYNGPPRGLPNCNITPCLGVHDTSGNTDNCIAIHAEVNAILQLEGRLHRAKIMYCTTKPCLKCALVICQTKIEKVVYLEDYPDDRGRAIFEQKGIILEQGVV